MRSLPPNQLAGLRRYSRTAVLILLATAAQLAASQTAPSATTESRDASVAYVGTANFVVGRVGRDCLTLLGRSDSPQEFVETWQQRNLKYLEASQKYIDARLAEAQATGGTGKREAVLRELTTAVRGGAAAIVQSWLIGPDKTDACKRAVAIIDTGAYDFSPTSPMYAELENLVAWAAKN